jgi:hypothetical protein
MNFPVQFLYSDILQHAMTKRTLKIEKINKNKKRQFLMVLLLYLGRAIISRLIRDVCVKVDGATSSSGR